MNAKVAPTKRTTVASRRHYHQPPSQKKDSWDNWVGDRRSRYGRWEWYFALFVVVVAVVGLIVWRTA